MFDRAAVKTFVETAAEGAFLGLSADACVEWVLEVAGVDGENPEDKHPLAFYGQMARMLAEQWGSTCMADFSDASAREQILNLIKPGAKPYEEEDDESWKKWVVTPAQQALALKFAKKAGEPAGPAPVDGAGTVLTAAMQDYVKAQQDHLKEQKKKHVLSYDLNKRRSEVGLEKLSDDAFPSEEAMIKVELLAKAASDQGRMWAGSAEGEDLQLNFRPEWSRTPKLEFPIGDGSLEDRMKRILDTKKGRTMTEKVSFISFANFLGHLLDWGTKMIVTKTFIPIDLLSYQHTLVAIAEEHGGAKIAFYYDLLIRKEMAKALERKETDLRPYMAVRNRDVLKEAKLKVETQIQEAGRDSARKGSGKDGGKKNDRSGKGTSSGSRQVAPQWSNDRRERSRSPRNDPKKNRDRRDEAERPRARGRW